MCAPIRIVDLSERNGFNNKNEERAEKNGYTGIERQQIETVLIVT